MNCITVKLTALDKSTGAFVIWVNSLPLFFFSHTSPLSHLPSGICSHLWCRKPSGVYSWIHQRSDQKVFFHRKVHRYNTSTCLYGPVGVCMFGPSYLPFFRTVYHIYMMSNLPACMYPPHTLNSFLLLYVHYAHSRSFVMYLAECLCHVCVGTPS